MKLILLRDYLKNGLNAVERGVAENANLPVLKGVLMKTGNGQLELSTTNLEIGITRYVNSKINNEGSITVPFNTLSSIVSNIDDDRINIEVDGAMLLIKTDNYQAKIQGIPAEEFPIIPSISNKEGVEISSIILREALSEVVNAAHISEIRPEISGILFDFQVTVLKLVATDSFRLGEKIINNNQFETKIDKGFRVIVPLKTIQEIIRIFTVDSTLSMYIDNNQILFKTNDTKVISRIIDGQYPDYEQIIPKEVETELVVKREKLISAVRLVSRFSGKTQDIKFRMSETGKVLEVYSATHDIGENKYLIPVKCSGKQFKETTFNARYLADGLRAVKTGEVLIGLSGESKPALIKPVNDFSYRYLVMPIKAG